MADTIYVPPVGQRNSLDTWTGKGTSQLSGGKMRLFKNNVTVDHTTTLGSLTEADFAGYAAVTLTGSTWSSASGNDPATSGYSSVTYTRSSSGASQSIYGAYITDSGNTALLACWNFAGGPLTVTNANDKITVTPTLSSQSLN